ncbi:hypothetical protein OG535_18150 [Kitasatospora sp. NBC_00085]|uniref:hypothetical protein n=1 Tax=Kitasatospora sp. NBC_00085 TaxID=2903566 RepID=UPI00325022D3
MTTDAEARQATPVTTKLHRLTVNLTEKAHQALADTAKLTGRSKTDTCNRALIVNAWVEKVIHDGGNIYVEERPGEVQKVKIL